MLSSRSFRSHTPTQYRFPLWAKILCGICVCGGFLWGLSWLSWYPKLTVNTVTVEGVLVLSKEDVSTYAQQYISGSYWKIFARNNIFLYPKKNLEKDLLIQFPRIKSVELVRSHTNTLVVTIHEREPFALWCDTPPTEENTVPTCYFLDTDGFVFTRSPQFSGDAYFKYYGILPFDGAIGSLYLASTTRFHELAHFVDVAKKLEISPLYIISKNQDSFELYVFGGGKIIFDTTQGLPKVTDNMSILLKTPNLIPRKNGMLDIDYIDLRFGNKLFYTLKEEPLLP
jgi:hypothetical protein